MWSWSDERKQGASKSYLLVDDDKKNWGIGACQEVIHLPSMRKALLSQCVKRRGRIK